MQLIIKKVREPQKIRDAIRWAIKITSASDPLVLEFDPPGAVLSRNGGSDDAVRVEQVDGKSRCTILGQPQHAYTITPEGEPDAVIKIEIAEQGIGSGGGKCGA